MGTTNPNPDTTAFGMSDGSEWTLERIRQAYSEILFAYNDLSPLHSETRRKHEDETQSFGQGDDNFLDAFRMKAKRLVPKIKEIADQSGNAMIWHRGESFEGLSLGMRERVERALKFGI
jgi:hypothetical protein